VISGSLRKTFERNLSFFKLKKKENPIEEFLPFTFLLYPFVIIAWGYLTVFRV
jgi:hypothetical protein